ncbi:MAG: SIMPL domain-containing protein [Pirellulaceae bacterium]
MHYSKSLALFLCVVFVGQLRAQDPYGFGGGISASSTEQISVKPTKMRLSMWVKAQGTDAKAAIKALNDHKSRVQKDLTAMKADATSISFSATRLTEGAGDQDPNARRMQQMMMMRAQGGNAAELPKAPTVFTATAAVKAEWTLPVQEGDALALLPATLKQQITSRDLAGDNNKPELDAAQQEQLEEMQAMMDEQFGYYSSGDNDARGPSITFVASVTDEQIQAATKAAYEAAVKQAQALVSATGLKLGSLRSVSSHRDAVYSPRSMYYGPSYSDSQFPNSLISDDDNTITAENADELIMPVSVSVSYALAE